MKRKRVDEKRSHALIVTFLSNIPTAWLINERLLSMLGNVSLGQVQNTKKRKLQQQQQQQKANSSNDKIRTTAWSFFCTTSVRWLGHKAHDCKYTNNLLLLFFKLYLYLLRWNTDEPVANNFTSCFFPDPKRYFTSGGTGSWTTSAAKSK